MESTSKKSTGKMMKRLQLIRNVSSDEGTTGLLYSPNFECATIELPWKDNRKNVSCIPTGIYKVEPFKSPNFGQVYQVLDVPDRTHILFHAGNWAGDKMKSYRSDSSGCILVGEEHALLYGQKAVAKSKAALTRLIIAMEYDEFQLEIIEQEGI